MTNLGGSRGDWNYIYECPQCGLPVAMEKRDDELVGKCAECNSKVEVSIEDYEEWQDEISDSMNISDSDIPVGLSEYKEENAYE